MSNYSRAIAIGMLGPAIAAAGLLWMLLEAASDSTPETANFRYFLFDSPHLMVAVGVLVSALCLPITIAVALASEDEVEIPIFDQQLQGDEELGEAAGQAATPYWRSSE